MTSTIRRPGVRAARAGFLAVPFLGLAVAVALVWQSSYAAFKAETDNGVNNWRSGSVGISDNDSNIAMFNLTDDGALRPGSTRSRCIEVTKSGTLASTVELYAVNRTDTNGLASHLDLVIDQGTGAVTGGSCTNFNASGANVYTGTLAAMGTTFATGHGDWAPPAGSQSRTYRITYKLNDATPDTAQGGTAAATFRWEAQNQTS